MAGKLFAQPKATPAEVIIIGTIHTGNKKFNHKTLYNAIKQVKPDIILREQDKPYKSVFGLKLVRFFRLGKPSIEKLSVQQYAKKNKDCSIQPYDTLIPDRRGYVKKWIAINSSFYKRMDSASLSTDDSITYASFRKTNKAYYAMVVRSTLADINHPSVMQQTRHLYETEKKQVLTLSKKYITDTTTIADFENTLVFWEKRNNYMARQAVKISKENPGKKILVLCGLNHKYYLTAYFQQVQIVVTDSYSLLAKE